MKTIALRILWPAFIAAGVLEMLVFALIDPTDLHWFGGAPIGWSAQAIYTVGFLLFWAIISMATAMTALLMLAPAELNALGKHSRIDRWMQR